MNDYNPTLQYNNDFPYSANGRFGRLAYLGRSMGLTLMFILAFAGLGLIGFVIYKVLGLDPSQDSTLNSILMLIGGVAALAIYGFFIYLTIIVGIRRLHDLNRTGWMYLLLFVPLVGFIFALYMIFAAGTPGENDYGLPYKTQSWEKFCGIFCFLIIPLIGILAAIAIPAYQSYVEKAQQQQVLMNQAQQELQASETELQKLEQELKAAEQGLGAASTVQSSY